MTLTVEWHVGTSFYFMPSPAEYRIGYYLPGTILRMSTGRPLPAASASDGRREFVLIWNALNGSWLDMLENAFRLLCTGGVNFTDPNGNVWSVIRHPTMEKIVFTAVLGRVDFDYWLWRTELRMVEVV